MSVGDPVHTCSERCPCHTGGVPREDFAEFGPERPVGGMKSLAHRVTTDIHDSIDMQAELDRLRALLVAAGDCVREALNCPAHSWHGSDKARGWLVDAYVKPWLRAGEHTGPLTAEQLADSLRDG